MSVNAVFSDPVPAYLVALSVSVVVCVVADPDVFLFALAVAPVHIGACPGARFFPAPLCTCTPSALSENVIIAGKKGKSVPQKVKFRGAYIIFVPKLTFLFQV